MSSANDNPVIALAASPSFQHDGTCFAATQRGLLKTTDHGDTWPLAFSFAAGAETVPVTAVGVSPAFQEDRTVLMAIPGGIGRSTDGGATWDFMRLPQPSPLVSALALSPHFATDQLAFAGTLQDGVFRSEDGGRTWTAWNSGLFDMSVATLAISDNAAEGMTVFAGTTTGILRSTNQGKSWHPLEGFAEFPSILSLSIEANNEPGQFTIWAGTESDGLWFSSDSGTTWSQFDTQITGPTIHVVSALPTCGSQWSAMLTDRSLMLVSSGHEHFHTIEDVPVQAKELMALTVATGRTGTPTALLGTTSGSLHRIDLPIIHPG